MTGTAKSFIIGYSPKVTIGKGNPEAAKYGKLWEDPNYRVYAPGENFAKSFLVKARPKRGSTAIDFGCGTGRGAVVLAGLGGMKVTMIDFVRNSLDENVKKLAETPDSGLTFVKADLEQRIPVIAEYGFCADVMEHIPPNKVQVVLDNILKAAEKVWFSICTAEDSFGGTIGEKLHLSVHPYEWWLEQLKARGCEIIWSEKSDELYSHFYVSAWSTGHEVVDGGRLNIAEEKIIENVRANCTGLKWHQVTPHDQNDFEVMILGGGPSINGFLPEIRQRRADGAKLLTLNGAYNWALHHGLVPSAQVVVDARPFNARFTKPVVDDCVYLIGSQCDPVVLEGLPEDRTYLWHTTAPQIEGILKETYGVYWPILGGSTALLRAIPLMRMLGYTKFHLYGCDSCLVSTDPTKPLVPEADATYTHHAYSQPENDSDFIVPLTVKSPKHSGHERVFHCHMWMASQAQEFVTMIKQLGDHIQLEVHGDGLLKYILDVGAETSDMLNVGEITLK